MRGRWLNRDRLINGRRTLEFEQSDLYSISPFNKFCNTSSFYLSTKSLNPTIITKMRPGSPQFGSQPGAIPELDYSSPSDVDLTNILYIHNIPMVPANMRPELDARIKSITSWMAWELTRIEDAVQDKIRDRDLPMDDSMASKLKRMSYRSKVLDYTRRVSRW